MDDNHTTASPESHQFYSLEDLRGRGPNYGNQSRLSFDVQYCQSVDESRHEAEHVEGEERRDRVDDEIECVLTVPSTLTTDSQRAQDFILPPRPYHAKTQNEETFGPSFSDEASVLSAWSKSSRVKPMFDFDAGSVLSSFSFSGPGRKKSSAKVSLSSSNRSMLFKDDDPWRAAKRGDLKALKKFYAHGSVDWAEEDKFQNVPLYYACHSGGIVDVMVVPFLLWVTPGMDPELIERCRRNAINQKVRMILKDFEGGGLSAIAINGIDITDPVPAESTHTGTEIWGSKVPRSVSRQLLQLKLALLKRKRLTPILYDRYCPSNKFLAEMQHLYSPTDKRTRTGLEGRR
jgi:hypothetical protein